MKLTKGPSAVCVLASNSALSRKPHFLGAASNQCLQMAVTLRQVHSREARDSSDHQIWLEDFPMALPNFLKLSGGLRHLYPDFPPPLTLQGLKMHTHGPSR